MTVKTHVPYSKLLNEPRAVLAEFELDITAGGGRCSGGWVPVFR